MKSKPCCLVSKLLTTHVTLLNKTWFIVNLTSHNFDIQDGTPVTLCFLCTSHNYRLGNLLLRCRFLGCHATLPCDIPKTAAKETMELPVVPTSPQRPVFSKYQKFPSQITKFETCHKRPRLL